ncbi:helicase-associated domain-containing protein [Corynebacterium sp. YIM 101645]|uniref:Helicase-associated domain-containing protein n=1 Tax=Corynebacterium lemuris TaxID=1859292 RepID=A0ABT2FZ21_9CORY|nr:helicase-associated domain-containing protein [Corynebacterium lemuris]MCS5480481.1 helicase-associated domain-containing protein [Corynebacterium lemuris]
MSATPESPDFRTWLAQCDDRELANLLRARPDVVLPLPPGITPLAARLELRASVGRALRTLNALELAALEAAADLGAELEPVAATDVINQVCAATTAAPAQVEQALRRLRELALCYGSGQSLRITAEAMSSLPQDWQLLDDAPAVMELAVIEKLSQPQRAILDTLLNSGGVGRTKHAAVDADPGHPVPQLINAGLLVRVDAGTVRLPRRVRALLRGGDVTQRPLTPSPRVLGETRADDRGRDRADHAGAGAGLEVARNLRQLIELLGENPAPLLKEGGVGVRAVTTLARALGVEETEIHRLVSLGTAAGLLGRGEPDPLPAGDEGSDYLSPTLAADGWLDSDLATRWVAMLSGWLDSPWAPWLIGTRDEKRQPVRLLSDAMKRPHLAEHRRLLVSRHTLVAPGVDVTDEQMRDDLFFTRPVAATLLPEETISEIVAEARWTGALAQGTATSVLRALLDPAADALAVAGEVTPGTVERVIPQADMTVMAPGPLSRDLQTELDLLGELESAGLASVYRVTETSVRRALDTGRTAAQLRDWLTDHSLGEVPQSIIYLIEDVARRHGTLRGGPALSYLRCDDPALLTEAARTPAAERVALRIIAPTVAVAQAPLAKVIEELREAGFQPVAEDATGAALDIRPKPARLPAPDIPVKALPVLDESRISAAVAAIRRADGAKEAGTAHTAPDTRTTLALLQAAARGGRTVTLGFVDKHGRAMHRTVTPLTVTGGQVDALDEVSGQVQRFMLHRITEVLLG